LQHRYEKTGAGEVPAELDREITRQFEEFYATVRESHYRPVLLHNDLWPSHILWDRAVHRPVGVIDWEDARLGDPAFDLTTLRGIGADLMEGLLAARRDPRDRTFNERLLFYRRILPLQSLLFGLETGQRALARTQLHLLRAALRLRSLEDA
ncbi:MAG: phosphotransferase, partial [Thermoplasmata archaeon]